MASRAALCLLLAGWSAAAGGDVHPRAFDGHRGFGAAPTADDVRRTMQARGGEDLEFVRSLEGLEAELERRFAASSQACRDRGYDALLELERGEEFSVPRLHAAFRARLAPPGPDFDAAGPRAGVLAAMLLDDRFRARVRAAAGWEEEARELRRSLAVLRATTDGYVVLSDAERGKVGVRADLAASRLRALLHDLEVLRPAALDDTARRAREQAVARLLGAAPAERRALLAAAEDRVDRMTSMLFGARLVARPEVAEVLAAREQAREQARRLAETALEYLPEGPAGEAARPEVAALRKHERMRLAGVAGAAGLEADPLNENCAYAAGRAEDFGWGPQRSRAPFDRYLALRGIRAHDRRTTKGRELTPWERTALAAVQAP